MLHRRIWSAILIVFTEMFFLMVMPYKATDFSKANANAAVHRAGVDITGKCADHTGRCADGQVFITFRENTINIGVRNCYF